MRNLVDALSPTNFAFTNPQVIERTLQTRGDNLRKGLQHMLDDGWPASKVYEAVVAEGLYVGRQTIGIHRGNSA